MRHFLIMPIILLLISSCKNNKPESSSQILLDTVAVKNWLTKVIIDYRNSEASLANENQLSSFLTDDYYRYKSMAIGIEYDTITREQFDEKWKANFQTEYVGKMGFFNWCQDCGTVEVPSCSFLRPISSSAQIFRVVLKDVRWQSNSEMDVVVVFKENQLLISDVRHYD